MKPYFIETYGTNKHLFFQASSKVRYFNICVLYSVNTTIDYQIVFLNRKVSLLYFQYKALVFDIYAV